MTANEAAIRQWNASATRAGMTATARDGDFAKRHLVNPELLRLLGDVRGRLVLDAGCGNGYFSRMLAGRGARVVGIEPAARMVEFAREQGEGVTYHQADLTRLPELGEEFDAVVCSMVLMAIPDWRPAMRACVDALRPGGLFVFAVVHPAFEQLYRSWREHGEYRVREYLVEYEIPGPAATDFHRPLSAYLNELAALGCRLREVAEPGLDPAEVHEPGLTGYVRLPNFLLVSAEKP
ncbi:bifunctional 2-polyprenyl-6-hydroxyphenol methylase/3-demethylubiquinol 3-O-methyltransferase UbiG [Amycolatopsis sp. 195334CR]|uniref:class I SAM-dependent methyltransferase n=1 Tax=Amycolatopsis sp. 195334CR TaxID=2814588 RepID=UPI001A8EAD11|nr:class I SAM-dependent methyltransferase [Amycolatopsis sp. 195334CR]MBN6037015.1 class I SAM-dependent methyltransferase [Amycolatopsis sp. 195334CR]